MQRQMGRGRFTLEHWLSKKKNQRRTTYTAMGLAIFILFMGLVFSLNHNSEVKYQHLQERKSWTEQREKLQDNLKQVQEQKAETQQQLKEKARAEEELKSKINDLNRQLQAKRERESLLARAVNTVTGTQTAYAASPAATGGCVTGYFTGQYALDQLISHESGGRSCATNAGGCFGLLQACPGYPLRAACGGDPGCQIQWFRDNKAGGRSWEQIWALWQTQGYW